MLIEPCKFWTKKIGVWSTQCPPPEPIEPPGPECGDYDWDNFEYTVISDTGSISDNGFVSEDGSTALIPAVLFSVSNYLKFKLVNNEYVYLGGIDLNAPSFTSLNGLSTTGELFAMYDSNYNIYYIARFTGDLTWETLHNVGRPSVPNTVTTSVFSDDFTRYYQIRENYGPPTGLYLEVYDFDLETGIFTFIKEVSYASGGDVHASDQIKISSNGEFIVCGWTDGLVVLKNMDGIYDWQIYGTYDYSPFDQYKMKPADISNNGEYVSMGIGATQEIQLIPIAMAAFDKDSLKYHVYDSNIRAPFDPAQLPCSVGFSNNGDYLVMLNKENEADNGGILRVKLECGR